VSPAESRTDKAQRLVNERRFTRLHPFVYAVQGDTSRYLVCVPDKDAALRNAGTPASCTCDARATCSHILGAHAIEKHVQAGGEYSPAPTA
jgi:hypothetical protein